MTVDYARHTASDKVHLLDLDEGKTLCGLAGVFERVATSDATDGGFCKECDNADQYKYQQGENA